jgi:CheY-like chemotaxis protein
MKKKLKCILLVDDNNDDNFFHKIIIKKADVAESIQVAENGLEALEFLKKEGQIIPELIFLDINMPKMNGWEFLEEYGKLDPKCKARITIMMLTTSANPDDIEKARHIQDVTGFRTKPLTEEMLSEIINEHFPDYK